MLHQTWNDACLANAWPIFSLFTQNSNKLRINSNKIGKIVRKLEQAVSKVS